MGLFRHYWVVAKLGIAVVASLLLLLHTQPIEAVAAVAAQKAMAEIDPLPHLRMRLVADAIAAIVALFVTTTLSVFKPQGLTPYGMRKVPGAADQSRLDAILASSRWWPRLIWAVGIGLLALIVVRHVLGRMAGH